MKEITIIVAGKHRVMINPDESKAGYLCPASIQESNVIVDVASAAELLDLSIKS